LRLVERINFKNQDVKSRRIVAGLLSLIWGFKPTSRFHMEMALFPRVRQSSLADSPRVFACGVLHVRLGVNPCAALLFEKIAHFRIGNYLVPTDRVSGLCNILVQFWLGPYFDFELSAFSYELNCFQL
jgi:hypothetical protein